MGFLIVLWMNRLPLMHEDQRAIPAAMQSYLESPPRPLSSFALSTASKLALTNGWLKGKWSFVYFSHSQCLPSCQASLDEIKSIQTAFATSDLQFLVIGLDAQHEGAADLSQFLSAHNYNFTTATASEKEIDQLTRQFIALYLQTDYSDGSYQIEQQHHLFLVDPKGRVYATFRPPYSDMRSRFLALRSFYAKTE